MKVIVPLALKNLAERLSAPLYVVGGYVRNFLIDGTLSSDIDIAAPLSTEEVVSAAESLGFKVVAEYKRTGTAVIFDGERKYEYTRFRTDVYDKGGGHTPVRTEFTDDIKLDALRRDFTCNAVYYDIVRDEIVDPLGGVNDIETKTLNAVKSPREVFSSDGLRLMRLARFTGELNFTPTVGVLNGAKEYAENIKDIAPERIYDELKKILVADTKYPFSDKVGHYSALKVLERTGVLDILFPELTAGRGLVQKAEFHKHDVLEHSLRTLLYADKTVRLAALFHDVGKPFCKKNYGTYKGHAEMGEAIARDILKRLKADKRTVDRVTALVRYHMFDVKCDEEEKSVRRFIVENRAILSDLLKLKQADFTAGKDQPSIAPTVSKWLAIYGKMQSDGTPFTLKDLKITANDLIIIGFNGRAVGEELKALFDFAVENPDKNIKKVLRDKAIEDLELLSSPLDKK